MNLINFLRSYYVVSLSWLLVLTVLSVLPNGYFPRMPVTNFDKMVHITLYFILITSLLWSASAQTLTVKKVIVFSVLVILYGFTIEIIQETFCINRHFEWWDVFSNSLGTIIGSIFVQKILINFNFFKANI